MSMSCPVCDNDIDLPADVDLGEVLACPSCDADLEVTSIEPLVVEPFEEEEK